LIIVSSNREEYGENSEGFITTIFPAPTAPISGNNVKLKGKFHGDMINTFPYACG
jgi:hypothetical protein